MGIMTGESFVSGGGSEYKPDNAVVTIKSMKFGTPEGWDNHVLLVDLEWEGMPDGKFADAYSCGKVEYEKDCQTIKENDNGKLSLHTSTRAYDFINAIAEQCRVAGIEIEDSNSIAIFEGLQVKMIDKPMIDKRTKEPLMEEGSDGKKYPKTELIVKEVIGFATDKKSSKSASTKSEKSDELPQYILNAIDTVVNRDEKPVDTHMKCIMAIKKMKDPDGNPIKLSSDQSVMVKKMFG